MRVGDRSIVGYEEAGTLWLWAWPELLGWTSTITWLFSPVVHNTVWPGDLWGIDQEGNLLIVETKIAKGGRGTDPFMDFLKFKPRRKLEEVRDRWARLYSGECKFMNDNLHPLREGSLSLNPYPGVVPYSRQRREVRRWRSIYLQRIAPKLMSRKYKQCVEAGLSAYEEAGFPKPRYIALFTLLPGGQATLSAKGVDHYYQMLEQPVGAERLHMVAVGAREVKKQSCWEIQSYALELPDVTQQS